MDPTTRNSSLRDAVIAEAMTWLRTPYHDHARVKGVGVDCAQMPIAVYSAVGLIAPFEVDYPKDIYLHKNNEIYIEHVLSAGAVEISAGQAQKGDLAIWRWGRAFAHGGIMLPNNQIIHALVDIGVTLDSLDTCEDLIRRPVKWFTFWP